jgi:hypothetical protein
MVIDPESPNGNSYFLLATVRNLFKEIGRLDEMKAVNEAAFAGDYRHLCEVVDDATFGSIRVLDYTSDRAAYEHDGEEKPIPHPVRYAMPRQRAA